MTRKSDSDTTLSSVASDLGGEYGSTRLMLTIVFHPDTRRIGQLADCASSGARRAWMLGRNAPDFLPVAAGGDKPAGLPLEDKYISRCALQFEYDGKSVWLTREPSACRAAVGGRELNSVLELGPEELLSGTVILLAHRVVLLLRQQRRADLPLAGVRLSSRLQGNSSYMQALQARIAAVAVSDLDVLILGETGTGKELVASAIHANSARAAAPMVAVNMSAIPAELAPAALFGSARGAYTGADVARTGYFEQAEGGIVFMDEVGDSPLEIQAQLLRVLQQREIQVVGGPIRALNFRAIAATDAAIEAGSGFKAALRHRLGACEIRLEPLRDYPEDIGVLLWFFLERLMREAGAGEFLPGPDSDKKKIARWADLFHAFARFAWPGNVRQLSNFAQRVALASVRGLSLPGELRGELESGAAPTGSQSAGKRKSRQIGEDELLTALAAASYEPTVAARLLNISRTTLYRRIENSPDLTIASRVSDQRIRAALSSCGGDVDAAALQLRVSPHGLRARVRSAGLDRE